MATYTAEENVRALRAWNAWKDVCWVHGVGKPHGDSPVVGTREDEEVLDSMITRAFRRKISPFTRLLENAERGGSPLADLDCAQEFDDALAAYQLSEAPGHERYTKGHFGDSAYVRRAKAWKDCVWAAVATSDDPPLKVIIGKLLGEKGVINQVVEDWILANYSCRFVAKELKFDKSRDASPVEKRRESGTDASDMDEVEKIVAESVSPGSMDDPGGSFEPEATECADIGESICVPKAWLKELESAFSPRISSLLYAKIAGVKIYDDVEVLEALGVGKSTAAAELKRFLANCENTLASLNQELKDWLRLDAAGKKFFWEWLEHRCSLEKAGQLILSRASAVMTDK